MLTGLIIGIATASLGFALWRIRELTRTPKPAPVITSGPDGLDEWIAMLAHELRGPVSGMIGLADMALDDEGLPEGPVKTNLQLISRSGSRLAHLLNDILDAQRIRGGTLSCDPVPVHLRSIVHRVLLINSVQTSGRDIRLINDVPADCPNVMADPDQLEQILFNLVANAVKFTESGHVRVSCRVAGDKLDIRVDDTGKGVTQDNLDRILALTEDRLIPGAISNATIGLGLKITVRLLELHGSGLLAESATGVGSTFQFSLPTTTEPAAVDTAFVAQPIRERRGMAAAAPLPMQPRLGRQTSYRVMIVDDEAINLRILTAQLERAGYSVVECTDGQEALKRLETEDLPDLVLLDVMMPRMNGFDTLKKIRQRHTSSELPVILLTAKNQSTDILTGFQNGANDYVTKPIAKDELLARIKTHLELSKSLKAFSVFVPLEFLNYLGYRSMLEVRLGDQVQKHMTVLFCDIKDFSRISENMSPKEAFDFINTFLGVVSPVIRENGGFIDKYIGDAIMALFPNRPDDAVKAAVRTADVLKTLNATREASGTEPIRVGIGIHVGELMLGMVGEEQRMDGTVISDAVNTASRMEGLTKPFDTTIIVSAHVLGELENREAFNTKYLGKIKVKGKNERLDIHSVLEGDSPDKLELNRLTASHFEAGVSSFYERNFTAASVYFNEVLTINPDDKAAAIYLQRAAKLMVSGVPSDWDGTDLLF